MSHVRVVVPRGLVVLGLLVQLTDLCSDHCSGPFHHRSDLQSRSFVTLGAKISACSGESMPMQYSPSRHFCLGLRHLLVAAALFASWTALFAICDNDRFVDTTKDLQPTLRLFTRTEHELHYLSAMWNFSLSQLLKCRWQVSVCASSSMQSTPVSQAASADPKECMQIAGMTCHSSTRSEEIWLERGGSGRESEKQKSTGDRIAWARERERERARGLLTESKQDREPR